MLDQPSFTAGTFHTSFLDELLHQRRGEPFLRPDPSYEEVAAIAAGLLEAAAAGRPVPGGGQGPGWKNQVRRESLRD
jgi:hypothetical protein